MEDFNIEKSNDICDEFNNYLIQYLTTYNLTDIVSYILNNREIRLDILDNDGRNLFYIPIKFNYIELLQILIEYDKNNIGVSLLEIRDNIGYTGLYYSVIFNNFKAFKILYRENVDISSIDNMGNNIYMIGLQYKRNNILLYLLEHELSKSINTNHYINTMGESILQSIIIYEDNNYNELLESMFKNTNFIKSIVNNKEKEYGLTALHQCVVLNKNTIAFKLLDNDANINQSDFLGNTPIHYAMIEKNISFLNHTMNMVINWDTTNLNGDTPLHILLEMKELLDIPDYLTILKVLIKGTNLNIQNNMGITPLYHIVEKKLWLDKSIYNILIDGTKNLNIFITNKENISIIDILSVTGKNNMEQFIQMIVDSYYNILTTTKNNKKLTVPWEKYCNDNDLNKLKHLYSKKKLLAKNATAETYCKDYIKDMITTKKRSIPSYQNIALSIDSGFYQVGCFYTGSTIDILFGLVYLYQENPSIDLVLEYPLTENLELEKYYVKLGINYNYKIDFSNIEIIWSYMKLITLTNFDSLLNDRINNKKQFIVVPLGIEVATGSHANMIIIDTFNKTIERFEPNGKNYPRRFYYNPELLDSILHNKFKNISKLSSYHYIKPSDFLPTIGFQILETLEDERCRKIGDPNGYCAVWCVWWTNQRVTNPNIKPNILADELIKQIKLANKSFKNLIRNYSTKIVKMRDMFLNKYDLSIDDWMINNYDKKQVDSIEQDILKLVTL